MKCLHIVDKKLAKSLGLKFYFTGNPCKNGHYELRRVDNGACLSCMKERASKYYKKYYKENQEKLKEKTRKYILENKDKHIEYMQEWRTNNPNYSKEYMSKNKLKYKAYNSLRRSRLKNADGRHTDKDIENLFILQNGVCVGCDGDLKILSFHIDHKQPISKGGSNWPYNLQLLCPTCNLRKSDKDYNEWLIELDNNRNLLEFE